MAMGRILFGWAVAAALLAPPALADDAEVHSFHCLHGCPAGAPSTNDLVVREIYTLSSNDQTKLADWVAYRVTPQSIGSSGERRWAADPWLAPEETLEPEDYTGAPAALRIDRGHQAPLASFAGTPHAAATNLLSNITPQSAALNQGPWVALENAERTLVRRSGGAVFVLTGPLYERVMRPMPRADEAHRVPSGYWKIVATDDNRLSAFIMDQAMARTARFCTGRTTTEEIERRSGLRFFPRLARRNFRSLDSELGCP